MLKHYFTGSVNFKYCKWICQCSVIRCIEVALCLCFTGNSLQRRSLLNCSIMIHMGEYLSCSFSIMSCEKVSGCFFFVRSCFILRLFSALLVTWCSLQQQWDLPLTANAVFLEAWDFLLITRRWESIIPLKSTSPRPQIHLICLLYILSFWFPLFTQYCEVQNNTVPWQVWSYHCAWADSFVCCLSFYTVVLSMFSVCQICQYVSVLVTIFSAIFYYKYSLGLKKAPFLKKIVLDIF